MERFKFYEGPNCHIPRGMRSRHRHYALNACDFGPLYGYMALAVRL
jgi:hypothetical protein